MELKNTLSSASSPYLRSAARQPVAWQVWGEEALRLAKELDRPILLDSGAVWCHWCHVMDRESYEDERMAELINSRFVPVKVDRDERPDVDARFQAAVGAITGSGGWPLTAFLTPEGRVFHGGTYFPPVDTHGRPSLRTVLDRVEEYYRKNRGEALAQAEELQRGLRQFEQSAPGEPGAGMVEAVVESALGAFDPVHGGFGGAPKFPHAGAIEVLLRVLDRRENGPVREVVTLTLEKMALGGVYDQLGGGFHRYSVDARWVVPHFEKMCYDNASLLENYVHAFQAWGTPLFGETARSLIGYVDTVSPREGGFFASQDADITLEDDGDYFTWTRKEAEDALPPDLFRVMAAYYDIGARGEMRENPAKNVLHVAVEPEDIAAQLKVPVEEVRRRIAEGRRRMLEARGGRQAPFVDRTLYANWNGMMAHAYLEAYRGLGLESCRERALKALDRILGKMRMEDGGLYHALREKPEVPGFLDDQVQVSRALVSAYEASGEPRYLGEAERLMERVLERHQVDDGSLVDTPGMEPPVRPIQDTPTPSANGTAALVLERLHLLTEETRWREAAERLLRAFAGVAPRYGIFAATYVLALDHHLHPPPRAIVVGEAGDPRTRALHEAALRTYRPGAAVARVEPGQKRLPESVQGMVSAAREPSVFVCAGSTCAAPVTRPEEAARVLKKFGR